MSALIVALAGAFVACLAYLWGEHVGQDRGKEDRQYLPVSQAWIDEHRIDP